MQVKINCSKCGSDKVKIVSEGENPVPMYKCDRCGHKSRIFPKFESDKN